MLGSGLRYQSYVGRAKGFFRAQYFYSTPLQVKTFRTRCLYLFLCQSLFAPSPPPPSPLPLWVGLHRVVMVTFTFACGSFSLLKHLPHTHLLVMGSTET